MNLKALMLAAATTALISGAAFAQTDPASGSTATDGNPPPGTMLEDKTKMAPFYKDEGMMELRTGDEFKAALQAMSAEDQQRLRDECQNNTSPRATFCEGLKAVE